MFGRRRSLPLAALLLSMASLTSASTVAAECDGPFPEFENAVRTAQTIVVGEVVAVHPGGAWDPAFGGIASHFTLKVEHVLRGATDEIVEVKDLPSQPCASVIGARLGDHIALAVGGTEYTPPVTVNMIAWIDGPAPAEFGGGAPDGAKSYSVDQVFALAGLEPPASATAVPSADDRPAGVSTTASSDPPIVVGLVVASLAVVLALAGWAIRARRRPSD